MATVVDPRLIREIKRYGAFDISACFNCGNCTAVCPLSEEQGSFPRKLIRLGQIGARARLLASPEPWLCYACGECSETCPREAEPGEYMSALRRFAIARYEPTGAAAWMFRSVGVTMIVTLLLAVVLGLFLVGLKPGTDVSAYADAWVFRRLVPYGVIHVVGIAVFVVAALTILWGVASMALALRRGLPSGKWSFANVRRAAARTLAEMATMSRHVEGPDDAHAAQPVLLRPSVVHRAIMWGFGGLLLATVLDFAFIVLVPVATTLWPARVLGAVSGVVMLYGVGAAGWRRIRREDRIVARSHFADWWVLAVLAILGGTGFWLMGVVSIRASGAANDIVLLVHAALAMELVLLLAFTKMAHVLYRPVALFTHFLRITESTEGAAR